MEATAPTKPASKPALGRPSPSFRLHSRSLNVLRLRRVFDLFDRNGDGEITVQELSEALGRLGLEADADELASTVATYIKPGRAGLDFEDFESLHRSLGDALFGDVGCGDGDAATEDDEEESDLTEAFRVFDEDGDGYISAGELQTVLGKLGLPDGGCIGRVREMICSVDRNHDGQVDFREFKHMMGCISVYGS